jgi:hypothetical protein
MSVDLDVTATHNGNLDAPRADASEQTLFWCSSAKVANKETEKLTNSQVYDSNTQ